MIKKDAIFICNDGITKLPDNLPEKITGDCELDQNRLQSLKGAPKYVGGDFRIRQNRIKSLKYALKYIGKYFICSYNQISLIELLKYIISSEVKGYIGSDYDDDFINKFNKEKSSQNRIKMIFKTDPIKFIKREDHSR